MAFTGIRKVAAVGAVAAGLVAMTPAAANAGIYTWKFYKTYPTSAECHAAGQEFVTSGEADTYRCTGTSASDLYVGYIW
ncbi:hypothetical protein [Actinopolymorpha alba]|uniref:hypothetical protein n=1 Tax=Actinopolymorpha alba TaxID=533267 RepID=UPI00037A0B96|nr:hypothetical protein [Actinopolymorpha alba]